MTAPPLELACPAPTSTDVVTLAHGGGGRTAWRLLHERLLPALGVPAGAPSLDAATLALPAAGTLAFTTDATVVRPLFFPGGDLGTLAVNGAVNDLACVGARPLALSLALVAEEGLPLATLERLARSIRAAADAAGVAVVTGDTKVVDRGKGDGLYASVAGLGLVPPGVALTPAALRPGDALVVSGDVGRHGVAILSVREGLAFESPLESDCAAVTPLLDAALAAGVALRCLRDPTRGGLGAAVNEWCLDAGLALELDEPAIPVAPAVAAACELLGLDPLSMACEGRLVAAVAEADAARLVAAWRALPAGAGAALVGRFHPGPRGCVTLRTALGTERLLDFSSGEQLPRIC